MTEALGTAIEPVAVEAESALRKLIEDNDLSKFTPEERWQYYLAVCQATGLEPITRPLDFIKYRNTSKVSLYINKEGAAQLRRRNAVSIDKPDIQFQGGICIVSVSASTPDGRRDADVGIVGITGSDGNPLSGDYLGNAIKKAVTQGKRRATISVCGWGFLDETETDQIPGAERISILDERGLDEGTDQPIDQQPSGARRLAGTTAGIDLRESTGRDAREEEPIESSSSGRNQAYRTEQRQDRPGEATLEQLVEKLAQMREVKEEAIRKQVEEKCVIPTALYVTDDEQLKERARRWLLAEITKAERAGVSNKAAEPEEPTESEQAAISDSDIAAVMKLCKVLGRKIPDDLTDWTEERGKAEIQQLANEYNDRKKKSA